MGEEYYASTLSWRLKDVAEMDMYAQVFMEVDGKEVLVCYAEFDEYQRKVVLRTE